MKILLGESDSMFHTDGRAHLIIIHVTLDSGKQIQFPCEASKPVSEIYELVKNISDEKIVVPLVQATVPLVSVATPAAVVPLVSTVVASSTDTDNQIGKEDLVRCIKVEPRAKDSPIDIKVGEIYRVLKVHGPRLTIDGKIKQIIDGFDVIDDKSDTPRRIFAAPSEMEFYQKRKPAPVKVIGKFESTFLCPYCFILMVAVKEDDGKYHGKCMSCLKESTHELKAKEDAKPTVGNGSENEQARTGTPVPASV
jgi:hypothetical protein